MGTKRSERLALSFFLLFSLLFSALPAHAKVAQRVAHSLNPTPSTILPSSGYCKDSGQLDPRAILVRPKSPEIRGMAAGDRPNSIDDELDDYGGETATTVSDPFEGWNRFWFRFNDRFYVYVADPVYHGWEVITPPGFRWALKNFLHNALFPIRFVNNILQLKFKGAGVEFSRFMMNTMCSAGFSDPARKKKSIVPVDPAGEDFGQTLAVWGLGHGPYIVWPFVGPSSLRDSIGRVGDIFADPFFYVQPWWLAYASAGTLRFNDLDSVLTLYKDLSRAALDPYIAMREAYCNYRNLHVNQ
ncbi:MAG: VacJ family lipoprotein [Desulfovibrionaceae bacterium]|nr:VacJ family lipoprotein [Desulfovibrionaceae bacterium]